MKDFFTLMLLMFLASSVLFAIGVISLAAYKISPAITGMILLSTLATPFLIPLIFSVKLLKIKRG